MRVILFIILFLIFVGYSETSAERVSFEEFVSLACERWSVPPEIVWAVIQQESSGNHMAVSEKGCVDLMQISPQVWKIFMGERANFRLAFHRETNVWVGVQYLADLRAWRKDWDKVLRHYYSGNSYNRTTDVNRYVESVMRRAKTNIITSHRRKEMMLTS